MTKKEMLDEITSLIENFKKDQTILVAIDGVDTSGKTTLASELRDSIKSRPIVSISIDGFHNPKKVRTKRGELSPEGYYRDSFNYEFLTTQVLEKITQGVSEVPSQIFDYRSESEAKQQTIRIPGNAAILFEGVFLLREELIQYWDLSIFLDVSFETVIERTKMRDIEYFKDMNIILEKYKKRYIPGQKLYLAEANPKSKAGMVIDYNDFDRPKWLKKLG